LSFVLAAPEALVTATSDLAGIGSTLGTASAAAAAPTTGVLAAAADDVSAQVAALFSEHGLGFQQASSQLAAFQEQFVQTLSAGAGSYAAAEANAAQTLASAVDAPAAALLQNPVVGGAAVQASAGAATVSGALSNVANRVAGVALGGDAAGLLTQQITQGITGAGQAGALLLRPTGALGALTSPGGLLAPAASMTNAAAVPTTLASGSVGDAIKAGYLAIEPWVQYGFNLAAYAVGYLPYVGFLAPQINFFYDLFEPMVQSGLFNIIDWLQGSVTFAQGLSNFWSATTASINQFINTEINWVLGFLPPLPPIFP
jgi:hypothetical protein